MVSGGQPKRLEMPETSRSPSAHDCARSGASHAAETFETVNRSLMSSNPPHFSPTVNESLRSAGWYPGRTVDPTLIKAWSAFEWPFGGGYIYAFPLALKMLREFGGLEISRTGCSADMNIRFDPIKSSSECDAPSWAYYEWLLDERLFPVGITIDHMWTFSIGLRGRIYGQCQTSGGFLLLGETPEQGIEHIVLGFDMVSLKLAEKDKDAEVILASVQRLCKFNQD